MIHTLVESGKYYFLSRPRRFGKSLLLSTIKEIVSGSKELFKGLWIEGQWNWEQKYPVIHISFASIGVRTLGLTQAIFESLAENAERLGVSLEKTTIDQQFKELIRKVSALGKVVVLIDEYDKPIIDNLDDIPLAEQNRAVFKSFYSVLKDSDEYIRLLLITGVSKFTKVSIFSDLNNLNDITLHPKYATLAGITQQELESDFSMEIKEMQKSVPAILEEIREWYNGYSWHDGTQTVYNPFSLLLLFQTGYLTIKSYDPKSQTYELDYPNKEVESSLLDALLSAYRDVFPSDSMALTGDLGAALQANDIPRVMELLNALISTSI